LYSDYLDDVLADTVQSKSGSSRDDSLSRFKLLFANPSVTAVVVVVVVGFVLVACVRGLSRPPPPLWLLVFTTLAAAAAVVAAFNKSPPPPVTTGSDSRLAVFGFSFLFLNFNGLVFFTE
jgi:hypothetical protein